MDRHIASIHEGKKPFQCNICDATFVGKGGLNRHVASVHEKKKPFQCSICDSSFAEKSKLKGHISSVHEKKRISCTLCDRTYPYSQKSSLNKHMVLTHEASKSHHRHSLYSNDYKISESEDQAPDCYDQVLDESCCCCTVYIFRILVRYETFITRPQGPVIVIAKEEI